MGIGLAALPAPQVVTCRSLTTIRKYRTVNSIPFSIDGIPTKHNLSCGLSVIQNAACKNTATMSSSIGLK